MKKTITLYCVNSQNENHFFNTKKEALKDLTDGRVEEGETLIVYVNKGINQKECVSSLKIEASIFFNGNEKKILEKKY